MMKQTALGAANEALLGFPKWLLDRDATGIYKPEDTKEERFARGLGSFIGFFALPGAVFKKGGSMLLKAGGKAVLGTGMKKAVARGALRGAGGFAAYEALKAPEEGQKYKDKLTNVPLAAAIGGTVGVAGELIAPAIKKHGKSLYDNIIKKGSKIEYNKIMSNVATSATNVVKKADESFIKFLDSEQYGKARRLARAAYVGTRKKVAEAKINLKHSKFVDKTAKNRFTRNKDHADTLNSMQEDLFKDKNIAKQVYLGSKEFMNKSRQAFFSAGEYLNRQPGVAGKKFTNRTMQYRNLTEANAGKSVLNYSDSVYHLNERELSRFADVAEGRLLQTKYMKYPMEYWRKTRTNIYNDFNARAKQYNNPEILREINKTQNYFPHYMLTPNADKAAITETLKAAYERGDIPSIKKGKLMLDEYFAAYKQGSVDKNSELVKTLINKNSSIKSKDQAKGILLNSINREKQPGFKLLEGARDLNLPFWDPNPNRVIPRYVSSAKSRIAEIDLLGPNYEKLYKLTEQMRAEGADWEFAQRAIGRMKGADRLQTVFGMAPEMQGKIREIQVVTKLGLSSIPNATQSTNTALYTGTRQTAKQIANFFSKASNKKEMVDWALKTGATLESSLNQLYMGTGIEGSMAQSFLKKTGFIQLEKFNRIIAANAGKGYAQDMAKRLLKNPKDALAKRAFKKLGIKTSNIIARGNIAEEELVKASQGIVNMTQFRAGPMDLPLWFSSPYGRMVTQFKSFAFNQAKLIKNLLKEEVARGNFAPLIRAVAIMPILGEGVKDIRTLLTGQVRDEKGLDRLLDNVSSVGGIGMVNDLYQAARYNSMAGFMAGPTVSDLGKATTGVVKSTQGKPRQLERFILRQAPIVGPMLANTFTPSIRLKSKKRKLKKLKEEKQ